MNYSNQDPVQRKDALDRQHREIQERLSRIRHKMLVMSGKGGVGKSSVAAYLAVALAQRHFRVGLLDIDLHGPSVPQILGLTERIRAEDTGSHKAVPIKYLPNLAVMSIGMLLNEKDSAVVWRGPLKGGVIRKLIADVAWTDLDYMIIDSPPGTGDEPLTIAKTVKDAQALIVTTPQEVSLADVRKSIDFCRRVNMNIIGLVENMSGLQCPFCGRIIDVFKRHGGSAVAEKAHLKLLACLPLAPIIVDEGDRGGTGFLNNMELPITRDFSRLVDNILRIHAETDNVAIAEPSFCASR